MSEFILKSERLGFRAWQESDIAPFAEMNSDPVVMEFFPGLRSYQESKTATESFNKLIEKKGFGFFAVECLHNSEFIGFIGLNQPSFTSYFTPCLEIGWRLKTSAWNKGYATEGALACLEFGFKKLKAPEIFSFTSQLNQRSERVMQKAGMIKTGEFLHPKIEGGHALEKHVLYQIKNPY
ncbi:MAG: GNAT family N-acetyltransferase [Bacteroidia bacterium]|nr:GNAT family N-acetyltransferase [Bacteroidia bacterium]